jgi:hypothetical protein
MHAESAANTALLRLFGRVVGMRAGDPRMCDESITPARSERRSAHRSAAQRDNDVGTAT